MTTSLRDIPSVDRVLRLAPVQALIEAHGRAATTEAVRGMLERLRTALAEGGGPRRMGRRSRRGSPQRSMRGRTRPCAPCST